MKRFLAMLLAVLMIVSLLPTAAFAEETESEPAYVAQVGDTKYATFTDALAAWGPGKTLTLLSDVTTTSTFTVEVNATKSTNDWILKLGEFTWTATGCDAIKLYAAGGTVMNQNYGLKIYATTGGITAAGKNVIKCEYDVSTAGYRPRLEIHGGTYNGNVIINYASLTWNDTKVSNGPSVWTYANGDNVPVFNGKLNLAKCPTNFNAGVFNDTISTYPVSSTALTTLSGGAFKSFPTNSNSKADTTSIASGKGVLLDDEMYYNVLPTDTAMTESEADITASDKMTLGKKLTYSGVLYYETANNAIKDAKTSVTLHAGATADIDKNVTSGTLKINTSAEGASYTGTMTVSKTANLNIVGDGFTGTANMTGSGTLTVAVSEGEDFSGNIVSSGTGTVNVNGEGDFSGNIVSSGTGTVNVTGDFSGKVEVNGSGTINLTGDEFSGTIELNSANATVTVAEGTNVSNATVVLSEEAVFAAPKGFNEENITVPEGFELKTDEEGNYIAYQDPNHKVLKDAGITSYTEVASGFYMNDETYAKSTEFYITSADGLKYFRDLVNGGDTLTSYINSGLGSGLTKTDARFSGKTVNLLADVDLNNETWTPIGANYRTTDEKGKFSGNFDGQDHKISNLKIDVPASPDVRAGLFSVLDASGTTVKNLTINNVDAASEGNYLGALAGYISNGVTLDNVKVTGNINIVGHNYVGGFTGYSKATIKNCTVEGNDNSVIAGSGHIGGVTGYATSGDTYTNLTVKNITIDVATNTGAWGAVGGVAGYFGDSLTISNCNVENVEIDAHGSYDMTKIGTILGYSTNSTTDTSKATKLIDNTVTNATVKKGGDVQTINQSASKSSVPMLVGKDVVYDANGKITDGTFEKVPAAMIAEGFEAKDNGDGTYGIEKIVYAQIGTTPYYSLSEAFAAAEAGDVVEILAAGTYTLPDLPNNITVKGNVPGVKFDCTGSGSICSIPNGATFNNVAFDFGQSGYHGFQHAGTINMNNCELNGLLFSYGDMNFTGCTFNQTTKDYLMWLYAGDISFDDCTFNAQGKFFNVYNEGNTNDGWDVTVKDCVANNEGAGSKAVFNIKETCGAKNLTYDVELAGENTYTGALPTETSDENTNYYNSFLMVDDRRVGGTPDGGDIKVTTAKDTTLLETGMEKAATLDENIYETPQIDYKASVTINGVTTKYDDLHDALVAGSAKGAVVTLLKDVDLSDVDWTPVENFAGTFDGADFTISNLYIKNGGNIGLFKNINGGTVKNLTIEDAIVKGDGNKVGVLAATAGPATITNVTIKDSTASSFSGEYVGGLFGSGYATVSDCTLTGNKISGVEQVGGAIGFMWVGSIVNCTAENNTVTADVDRAGGLIGKFQCASGNLGGSTMKVNGNTVTGGSVTTDKKSGNTGGIAGQIMGDCDKFEIKGNTVNVANVDNPIGTLRDGQNADFTGALSQKITGNWWEDASLAADSYQYTNVASGVDAQTIYRGDAWVVKADNSTKAYKTVADAVDAAQAGETVKLICDVTLDEVLMITDKEINLDMNGKTLTMVEDGIIRVNGSSDVTVTGNGKVTANETTLGHCFLVYGGSAVLTLENGDYEAGMTVVQAGNSTGAGTLYIKGGTYKTTEEYDGHYWVLNKKDGTNSVISVTGGTFYSFDPNGASTENPDDNFCADGYYAFSNGDDTWTVKKTVATVTVGDVTTPYADLHTALEAGKAAGSVVTLCKDVDLEGIDWTPIAGFAGTFDGGNHTISNLTVNGTSGKEAFFSTAVGTIKDVTFVNANVTGTNYASVVVAQSGIDDSSKPLVLDNVDVKNSTVIGAQKCAALVGFATGVQNKPCCGSVTVTNCEVENVTFGAADNTIAQAGAIIGYACAPISVTATGNTVKGITIYDWYASEAGLGYDKPTFASHAFIGTIGNTQDYCDYDTYVINISGNTVEQATGTRVEKYTTDYFGGYYDWFDGYGKNPTKIVLDGVEITKYPDAKITNADGETYYKYFADAMKALKAGETITLMSDVADLGPVYLPAGVTFDGNGMTVSGASALYINKDGGTVQNVNFEDIHNNSNKQSAIYANGLSGTATVTGCTFDNCDWDAIQITPVAGAVISVTNNTFSDDMDDNIKQQRYVHIQSAKNVDFDATVTGNVMLGSTAQGALEAYYFTDDSTVDFSKNYIEDMSNVCILKNSGENVNEEVFPAYTEATKENLTSPVATIKGQYLSTFYASLAEAVKAAQAGQTVTLLADASGNGIQIDKDITIDLGGNTYTVANTVGSQDTKTNGFQLLKNNNVTFKNGTIDTVTEAGTKHLIQNYANLTLDNVTLDGTNLYNAGKTLYTLSNCDGEIVINNSKIIAAEGGIAFDAYYWPTGGYDAFSVSVKGKSVITGPIEYTGEAGYEENVTVQKDSTATVTAPEGYMWYGEGTQTLVPIVVTNGENGYANLEDAVKAAQAGDTVTLLRSISGNGIQIKKDITIDLGGNTYTVDGNLTGSQGTKTQAFQLLVGNDVTIKNGTIDTTEAAGAKMLIQNYSDLTLNNVKLDGTNLTGNKYTLSNNCGDIVLKNGTQIIAAEGGVAYDLYDWASGSTAYTGITLTMDDTVIVTGKTEVDGDRDVLNIVVDAPADKLPEAPKDYKWVETDGAMKLTPKDYVAEVIGGEKYESLAEAVAAAQSGATVQLIKDCSGDGIALMAADAKTITINLNDKTYDVTGDLVGSANTKSQAFHFEKGNTVTIKNGTLTSAEARMFMQNYADLTLDNVTLDGTKMPGEGRYVLSNNSGNVTVKDSTINAKDGDFAMDSCKSGSYTVPSVTVEGKSMINGNVELSGGNLALDNGALNGELSIYGETLSGTVTKSNNFYANAPEGYEWVNGVLTEKTTGAVAHNNEQNKDYMTLEAALEEAVAGETVVLLKDIENEKYVIVENGVTLDLDGHSITGAKLLYVTGNIIDTADFADRGVVETAAIMLGTDQTYTPICNGDGYSFYDLRVYDEYVSSSNKFRFILRGNNGERNAAYDLLKEYGEYGAIFKAVATVAWEDVDDASGEGIKVTQDFTYNDKYLKTHVESVNGSGSIQYLTLAVSGITGTATVQLKFVAYDTLGNELFTVYGQTYQTTDSGATWSVIN